MGTPKFSFSFDTFLVTFQDFQNFHYCEFASWLVQSKPLGNPPEERLPGNNWPPKPLGNLPPHPEERRSPIVIVPVPWLFVRSVVTKNPLSSSSVNCPSSVSREKLLMVSKLISGSRALPLALCKRPARLTWSACSKTPACAPSTPSVWPSCQRIFSSPEESVANEPKSSIYFTLYSAFKIHKDYYSVSSQNLHIFSAPFTSKESTAWTFRLIIDLHPVEAIVSLVDLPSYRTSFFFSFF